MTDPIRLRDLCESDLERSLLTCTDDAPPPSARHRAAIALGVGTAAAAAAGKTAAAAAPSAAKVAAGTGASPAIGSVGSAAAGAGAAVVKTNLFSSLLVKLAAVGVAGTVTTAAVITQIDEAPDDRVPTLELDAPTGDDRAAMAADRLPTTEIRRPITEVRPPMAEDGPPITEGRRPTTEERPPITDDRQPTTDDRRPTTDDRTPETEPSEISSPRPTDTLSAEIALVDRARAALASGDGARALGIAGQYRATFGSGILAQEMALLSIEGRLATGDPSTARAEVRDFLRHFPDSPLLDKVRAADQRAARAEDGE